MKIKKIFFIIICLMMLLAPNNALAAETFNYGDYKYSIEKINLKTDSLPNEALFVEIDEQGNYIFEDHSANKLYKVNEKECVLMSDEEILKFKSTETLKNLHISGYDVLESEQLMYLDNGYVKTSDTEINPDKTYWEANTINEDGRIESFGTVLIPDISKINTYYEETYFKYPTSMEIDENETYYMRDEITGTFVKVDTPTSADINKYRVKYNRVETKIATLNSTNFDKILENYYIWNVHRDEETNELLVLVTNGYDIAIYTIEGTLVREFKGIEPSIFSWYSNSFFGIKEDQGKFKIMDKDANIIFESETLPLLFEIKNEKDTMYFLGFDNNGREEFYYMNKVKIEKENDNIDNGTGTGANADTSASDNNTTIPENKGEKDDTPKTGDNMQLEYNKLLFVGLILILTISIITTKTTKKNK